MSRAFVAGATGLTGRFVVQALREAGVDTVARVRPDSGRLAEWRERFEQEGASVDTTPWAEAPMRDTLRALRPSLVFALLGTTRKRQKADSAQGADSSYEAIDYGLTAMLLAACRGIEPQPRFVYLSSMGVGPKARGRYLQVRHRLEELLRASELPHIIARPSFIVGDRDEHRPGEAVGSTIADGLLALVGALGGRTIRDRYRSNTGQGLARALVRHALDPAGPSLTLPSDALQDH